MSNPVGDAGLSLISTAFSWPIFRVGAYRALSAFFQLSRSGLAGLKPDAVDFDSSLERINVEVRGFEHDAILDECGESTQAGPHSFRAPKSPDHQGMCQAPR